VSILKEGRGELPEPGVQPFWGFLLRWSGQDKPDLFTATRKLSVAPDRHRLRPPGNATEVLAHRDGRERSTMERAGQRSGELAIAAPTPDSIAGLGGKSMSTAVMMQRIPGASPRPSARITGVVYLLYFLTRCIRE